MAVATTLGKVETLYNNDLLWNAEFEEGDEFWIECVYFSGAVKRGKVRYAGPVKEPVIGSNEFIWIPSFRALDFNLDVGRVPKYRILQ